MMQQEVDRLLKPAGLSLRWRLAGENQGRETFAGLVVLNFKGICKADGVPRPSDDFGSMGETRALASTQVLRGRVLPYSDVECDELRKALAFLAPGSGRLERQTALGRAMGRVVAHELYHILASTTSHAETGLAKATHSLSELVSPNRQGFLEESSREIRQHLTVAASGEPRP